MLSNNIVLKISPDLSKLEIENNLLAPPFQTDLVNKQIENENDPTLKKSFFSEFGECWDPVQIESRFSRLGAG